MSSSRERTAYAAPALLIDMLACGASGHHSAAATVIARDGHYVDGDPYGCDADGFNCFSYRSDLDADDVVRWMPKVCTTLVMLLPARVRGVNHPERGCVQDDKRWCWDARAKGKCGVPPMQL